MLREKPLGKPTQFNDGDGRNAGRKTWAKVA